MAGLGCLEWFFRNSPPSSPTLSSPTRPSPRVAQTPKSARCKSAPPSFLLYISGQLRQSWEGTRFLLLLIIVSLELLEVTRTLQRGSVEWQAKEQVAGKCFDPQAAGIYHWLQVCRHTHTNTFTPPLWPERFRRKLGAPISALAPRRPPLGRSPRVLVQHRDAGACGPLPLPRFPLPGSPGGQGTHSPESSALTPCCRRP